MHNGKPVEGTNIAIVSEHSRADYSEAKSVALKILQFAGIGAFKLEEYRDPAFISGRAASIIADGKKIGHFGEISPRVLRNFRLEEPVVAIEMDMEEIYRAGIEHSKKP
jgi:phenylalanyl-tRNA synthetase beta chain